MCLPWSGKGLGFEGILDGIKSGENLKAQPFYALLVVHSAKSIQSWTPQPRHPHIIVTVATSLLDPHMTTSITASDEQRVKNKTLKMLIKK